MFKKGFATAGENLKPKYREVYFLMVQSVVQRQNYDGIIKKPINLKTMFKKKLGADIM